MSISKTRFVLPQSTFDQCRDGETVILDVRTGIEFSEKYLSNSKHLPLDQLKDSLNQIDSSKHHYLLCLSGKRAAKAAEILAQNGFENFSVIDGGIDAWERSGLPVERPERKVLPLMRQVQLVIGVLTLTGSLLAIFVNPLFAALPAFLGAGLTLAGSTGWCGLALLLARMPWNQGIASCGTTCSPEPLN